MNRRFWINTHLYLAALFAPMLLLVAISGGLYLVGVKGSVAKTTVALPAVASLDSQSQTLEADVRALLSDAGIAHDFEYLKVAGNTLYTRPTSKTHYELNITASGVSATKNTPDLQKTLIELHKGHGPTLFKTFQKLLAVGLLIVVLSGLWLGLTASGLRNTTLGFSGLGLVLFLVFGFML